MCESPRGLEQHRPTLRNQHLLGPLDALTSEAALKVISIGRAPAGQRAPRGRRSIFPDKIDEIAGGGAKTRHDIHVIRRASPRMIINCEPSDDPGHSAARDTLEIFIDIIKNWHQPLTAIKASRRINKPGISILRHTPAVAVVQKLLIRSFLRFLFFLARFCRLQNPARRAEMSATRFYSCS